MFSGLSLGRQELGETVSEIGVSGGAGQQIPGLAPFLAGHAVRSLPTSDTRSGPRRRHKPLHTNVLFAVETDPEGARVNTAERGSDFTRQFGIAVQDIDCQVAFLAMLNPV
jgi:hypothetical protein